MSEPTGSHLPDREVTVDPDDPTSPEVTTDPPTADHGDAPPADGSAPPAGPGRQRPVSWWVGWVVAVVGLVTAAVLAVLLFQDDGLEGERGAVEEAAGRFALSLTDWDASDGMGDTREELRAASTENFGAEVDQLFGGTDDLAELEEIGARSSAEVDDVLVQRLDGDRAEVLVVAVQRLTTDITEGEERTLRYARLGLAREDGEWRVDRVELLVDLLQEAAERVPGAEQPGGTLDLDAPSETPEADDADTDAAEGEDTP